MFDSFTQLDSSMTRNFGGSGLGLTIAKRLVEKMGGTISAASKIGLGSTFSFKIPLSIGTNGQADKKLLNICIVNKPILIVDDIKTNRFILSEMLKEYTDKIVEAEEGLMALKKIEEQKNKGERFALIIVDCRMPGMDGFELVEKIKCQGLSPETMVVMLTSDNRYGDQLKARKLEIDSYLVKPVSKKKLMASIGKIQQIHDNKEIKIKKIKERKQEEYLPAQDKDNDRESYKLLLVEDSPDNRNLILAYLRKTNYKIEVAEDGQQAVDKFKENEYDLILMDIQMPVKDGYTATKEIRSIERQEKRTAIPILAITAHALIEDKQKSMDAGCNAHLTKPIKKSVLLREIELHIQKNGS